jgi:hypothetical protein
MVPAAPYRPVRPSLKAFVLSKTLRALPEW